MAFLFKSGDELFDEGVDLVKRKEYNKARSNFEKCVQKGTTNSNLATTYISIISMISDPNNPNVYTALAKNLRSSNTPTFEFGLTQVESEKLADECDLVAERIVLMAKNGNADVREQKGKDLIQLGQKYQMKLGKDTLKTNELINGDTATSGIKESLSIQALGYETLASASVLTDPKKAAEYLQNAYNYRKQAGDDGSHDMELIQSYSRSAKCWICGRTTTGEGIHFVTMSSEITPFMKSAQDDLLKSAPADFESVYVCRPCYSAISRRSDAIANKYYQDAIKDLRETEMRLRLEIAEVRASVAMVRMR
ncbi:MAG: hypothetical protein KRP56_07640 [Candidatus Methanogranum gryphiswaldense]|nr:MAG: hypothetical protein KRP56_07640 [Candidatus Methanogranum sp. U3.2.1]